MKTLFVLAIASLVACSRPAPRAPTVERRSGVVIMSISDVEPYEHISPPAPKPPPKIEYAAPLVGALSGALTGIMVNTGLTLLTEQRWPSDRKRDSERANKALLYGAGIGLAAGTFTLAHSIAERMKWRERE